MQTANTEVESFPKDLEHERKRPVQPKHTKLKIQFYDEDVPCGIQEMWTELSGRAVNVKWGECSKKCRSSQFQISVYF